MSESWREVCCGVWRIDVFHPQADKTCCYLIAESDRGVLIDCGATNGINSIMGAIAAAGLRPQQIEWLLATHAHLDHAGAAGQLMRDHLPNATLGAHASALRHLTEPADKLLPAVRTLFGGQFYDEQYAGIVAVEKSRTQELADNQIITVGGCQLQILHTPGHAWHHLCAYDPAHDLLYAGDAYGVSYRALDRDKAAFIAPVMPPNQFCPKTMRQSLRRLRELSAARVALAHFDVIDNTAALADVQIAAIDDWEKQARQIAQEQPDKFKPLFAEYLRGWYKQTATAHGFDGEAVAQRHAHDIHLSLNGFAHWLKTA